MRYQLVEKEDLLALPSTTDPFYIPNLLPTSGTTIVYGVPGEGKSTICMEWALALENGLPFAGSEHFMGDLVGKPIRTAWLSFEDDWSEEVRGRLMMHGNDKSWPLFVAEPTGGDWTDALSLVLATSFGDAGAAMNREAESHWNDLCMQLQEKHVKVLFIDTLSELVDSNASTIIIQHCFRLFGEMRRRYGITFVLIGHASSHTRPGGKKSTELLGATAWVAKARHTVLVDGNTRETWAKVMKSNRGPTGFNVTMRKVDGGPVDVVKVNTASEYVEERQKSQQQRDWALMREHARLALEAGPAHWKSATSLGAAFNMSATAGRKLVSAGFFTHLGHGRYEPNRELIFEGVA